MDFSNVTNNTYTLVLLVLAVVGFVYLCLYYGIIVLRVAKSNGRFPDVKGKHAGMNLPSVSVVIVAHNEADFLRECLPYLLEQDYPDFEVVVVDYTSNDDTSFVLQVCTENYSNLKAINFPEDVNMFRGKKYPLSIGIKSATKDVILLTEPDSVPKDFTWIREMMDGRLHGASLTLGCTMLKDGKGLLHALQTYDNIMYNASCLGWALAGMPYSGCGRNMAYDRKFFFDCGGFISHYSIVNGDDDLFVNQNADKQNTAVVLSDNSIVVAQPSPSNKLWRQDRIQRRSTRRYYNSKSKIVLSLYPLAQVLFLAAIVLMWALSLFPWQILAAALALKFAWQIICYYFFDKKFKIKYIHFFSPFFELYFLFSNTFLYFFSLRRKNNRWR